ncbi:MAG: MFS transporter [Alphaproteobacteria bacterium]|nr:MFS transporter [Alphaproteobacteria bacterium]
MIPDDFRKFLMDVRARARAYLRPPEGGSLTTAEERRRAFQILFLSLVCLGSGQSIMFAILPPLSRDLGLSEFQVGLIFAISATIWIFSSPYWGRWSDLYGRRPMMLMGLNAFGISTLLFASVMWFGMHGLLWGWLVYPLMIAARSIYGVFGSGTFPSAQAYIADRTSREERASGVATITAAFGLGVALGPGVGALVARIDILAPFYVVSVAAFVSALAIYLLLPERTAPKAADTVPAMSWRDRRVLPFLIYGTALNSVGALPIQLYGFFLMDQLGYGKEQAAEFSGVGLMASSIAALLAQFVVVQRFRLSSRALVQWGGVIALVSNVLFVFGSSYGILTFAMVLSGLGFGMARPGFAAAASLAVRPEEQGAVAGLVGATGGAGFIFAPIIGNFLYEFEPTLPFIVGGVLMAGLLLYAVFNPTMRNMSDDVPDTPESGIPKS